jgi:hypothetical protein
MKNSNRKEGFTVPDGYFENATGRILNAMGNIKAESNNEGFKVPAGYFEELNTKITQQLKDKDTKVVQLNAYKKYYYAAAVAAVALLAFIFQNNTNENVSYIIEDLAFSDIETYFENTELGFSSYEIAEMIPADELEINDMLSTSLQEENIIEYLNENIDAFDELNLENNE